MLTSSKNVPITNVNILKERTTEYDSNEGSTNFILWVERKLWLFMCQISCIFRQNVKKCQKTCFELLWTQMGIISVSSDLLQSWTEVRYHKKEQSDEVLRKSDDVTSRDVIFDFDVKNVLTSAKMKGPRHNFIILIKKFHLLSLKQGVNHLHTSTKKNTIVIWKMSDFFDVIVKIWRHDDVT